MLTRFFIILVLVLHVTTVYANNFYIGAGVGFSENSYTSKGVNTGNSNVLRQAYKSINRKAIDSTLSFNGSLSQFVNLITSTLPDTPSASNGFDPLNVPITISVNGGIASFDNICLQSGVVVALNQCGGIGNTAPNINLIQQAFGSAYLTFLTTNSVFVSAGISISFATPTDQTNFQDQLGTAVLQTFLSTPQTPQTLASVLSAFTGSSQNELFNQIDTSVNGTNIPITIITPANATEYEQIFLPSQVSILSILTDPFIVTLNIGNQPAIIVSDVSGELNSIPQSVNGGNIEISLLAGYRYRYNKIYFFGEILLDLENGKIGRRKNKEIEVTHKMTTGLLLRVGYELFPRSINYANAGMVFRDYNIKFNGSKTSFGDKSYFVPHYLIGTGIEFLYNKNINLFAEFNHIFTAKDVETGNPLGSKLQIRQEQVKLGAKYYFY